MFSAVALATIISPLYASPTTPAPTAAPADATAAATANWGTDLPAALAQAQSSGKAVLIVFTGSDWCPPCKMLKQNVFDKPAFPAFAQKNFELVDIDIPNGNHVSDEQKALNRALAQAMNVQGFPTSLILSKDGAIIGGFVGYRDWAETEAMWNEALANKAKADDAFAAAEQLSGLEKAKALSAIAELCPADLRGNNVALSAQIMEADTDDTLGLRAAAAQAAAKKAVEDEVDALINNTPHDQMLSVLDQQLARTDLSPELELTLKWVRLNTLLMNCQSVEEIAQVKEDIIEYGKQYPSQQEQVDRVIKGLFSLPMEVILKRIQSIQR